MPCTRRSRCNADDGSSTGIPRRLSATFQSSRTPSASKRGAMRKRREPSNASGSPVLVERVDGHAQPVHAVLQRAHGTSRGASCARACRNAVARCMPRPSCKSPHDTGALLRALLALGLCAAAQKLCSSCRRWASTWDCSDSASSRVRCSERTKLREGCGNGKEKRQRCVLSQENSPRLLLLPNLVVVEQKYEIDQRTASHCSHIHRRSREGQQDEAQHAHAVSVTPTAASTANPALARA